MPINYFIIFIILTYQSLNELGNGPRNGPERVNYPISIIPTKTVILWKFYYFIGLRLRKSF